MACRIVQFYNGIQYAEIFTLAVYVVRRFEGEGATEQRVGQLAGLLAAASSFAVGCAAWPWGLISDRVGRKPVILLGNCATAACILVFSSARVYWVALLSRLIAGLLDGSLVMTKVMVGETCTPNMQAQVMSYLALGDAMGNIVGPALGGLLADPCGRFNSLKDTAMCRSSSPFAMYPFFLPCALTACLGILTSVTNVLTMDETLPARAKSKYKRLPPQPSDVELTAASRQTSLDLAAGPVEADVPSVAEMLSGSKLADIREEDKWQRRVKTQSTWETGESPAGGDQMAQSGSTQSAETETTSPGKLRMHDSVQSHYTLPADKSAADGLDVRWEAGSDRSSKEGEELLDRTSSDIEAGNGGKVEDEMEMPWWRNKPLLMTLAVTAWMLSIAKYNDELGPVFVSAPVKQGGLGMPLDAFALPLSFGGVVLTLFAIFGYPKLQRAVGLKMTCSIGLLAGIPGDLILPAAALLRWQPILEQATIFIAIAITKLTTQTAFTASMVIINSLAPRAQLGSVNGVRMMMAALGRSSGPILGGTLWGVSATLTFPGHHFLGFIVASFALVGCWYLHHRTPISIAT